MRPIHAPILPRPFMFYAQWRRASRGALLRATARRNDPASQCRTSPSLPKRWLDATALQSFAKYAAVSASINIISCAALWSARGVEPPHWEGGGIVKLPKRWLDATALQSFAKYAVVSASINIISCAALWSARGVEPPLWEGGGIVKLAKRWLDATALQSFAKYAVVSASSRRFGREGES
jgi:hypothetical protein